MRVLLNIPDTAAPVFVSESKFEPMSKIPLVSVKTPVMVALFSVFAPALLLSTRLLYAPVPERFCWVVPASVMFPVPVCVPLCVMLPVTVTVLLLSSSVLPELMVRFPFTRILRLSVSVPLPPVSTRLAKFVKFADEPLILCAAARLKVVVCVAVCGRNPPTFKPAVVVLLLLTKLPPMNTLSPLASKILLSLLMVSVPESESELVSVMGLIRKRPVATLPALPVMVSALSAMLQSISNV